MTRLKKSIACLLVVLIAACSLLFSTVSFAETKKPEKVTFNFVDVDLTSVTKFISEITGKNFIFDERLKGKITIIAPSKLSIEDAYNLFTSVLEIKGFTVIPSGVDAYKIIPSSEAKQRGTQITTERLPVNESYIARLIPLKYVSSDDALKFFQPIISKDGHISAFGPGNLLLVIDSGLNIEKIISIIDSIDQPAMRDIPEIIFLKYASADTVAKILNEGLGKKTKAAAQTATIEEVKAVADSRLNAIILVGDKGIRESMKGLIALLDVPSPEAQGRISVYFLENADATELGKVLEGMLKGVQSAKQPAAGTAAPSTITPFEAGTGITITPDKATNSLVISASPGDYQNLIQVIKHLDRRRRQVFVEAMIVEASLNKLKEAGTKWRAMASNNGEPILIGGTGNIDSTAVDGIISGLSGLSIGSYGNYMTVPMTSSDGTTTDVTIPGLAVLFGLSDFKDAVNVLSTPQILTADNKEAEIIVGENVPFISKVEKDTSTGEYYNTIERKDVGISLKLTPQVTEGDHVKLDIYQEISSVVQESNTEILTSMGPTITKRSTKTSVVVKDNQTVVISGLMQEKDEDSETKVPLLGDIPILGWLFKYKTTSKEKTNLLVFLTPHIIKEPADLAKITEDKHKKFIIEEKQYIEGELLVKFKKDVPVEKALELIVNKEASVIKFIDNIEVFHIKLKDDQTVEEAVKEFAAMPEVQYAEPNYKVKINKQ